MSKDCSGILRGLQVHGKAVTVPGRALAGIITNLKDSLDPEASELLQSYHQLVVNFLRSLSSDTSLSPKAHALQEKLAAKLPVLKSVVGL